MRVLLTSPYAHPHVRRGAERYVAELAGWLAAQGHDVTLVTTGPANNRVRSSPGLVIEYRAARQNAVQVGRRVLVSSLASTALPIGRAVRRIDADVAQSHGWPDGFALRVTGKRPHVFWVPGVPRRARLRRPIDQGMAVAALRGANSVVALSTYAAGFLESEFGVSGLVLPPGVDTVRFAGERPPQRRPIVLSTAAADDPRKRIDVLVEAFRRIASIESEARLVLAPSRPDVARALVSTLPASVRSRCDVLTDLSLEQLGDLYRAATVSVLPSVDEAFGLVSVESLAAGTPVVASNHGALPEVIDDGVTGYLVPPDDPDALADGLLRGIRLASEPGSVLRCRGAAKAWDWSVIGPRHEHLYRSLHAELVVQ